MKGALCLFFLFTTIVISSRGQSLSSLRSKSISIKADTVVVDTFSLAPGTFRITDGNKYIDTSAYTLDFIHSNLIWKKNSEAYKSISGDSIKVQYRAFSFLFSKEYRNKSTSLLVSGSSSSPVFYAPGNEQPEIFRVQGLSRSGSISRELTFGNNQDVFVNSSLNLQLAGKLSDNIDILAAITDENIPVQPEGNTQQLQDFDKVFIQLSNKNNKLIAGDFELRRPDSYFLNFYKKGQGGLFTTEIPLSKNPSKKRIMRSGISLAVSKGKYANNTIQVTEGNQGPYRLTGNNGETYIIILSGTEKIFYNGKQLVRGAQYDYIIDYNTAELTFTANRLITKESRIVAEFEYSDKNYARSLVFFNNEFESDKLKIKFNYFNEQDSKNQPLSIELDSTKEAVMANAGDSIQYAYYPTADSIPFNANAVLYQRKDTVTASGTYSIYLYSTNPDSAYWQLSFTEVGSQNGDYILDITSVNGRVFKWVEPVNGIPQGNYLPVSLLVTPKKQQMLTTGVEYFFNNKNSISVEGAYSLNDVNLFSSKDKSNDKGYATRVIYKNEVPLGSKAAGGWLLSNLLNYEFTDKNFTPIERYRNVEFERDWNLGTASIDDDEHISTVQSTISKPSVLNLTYQLKSFNKGSTYSGIMNSGNGNFKYKDFNLFGGCSYLNTDGLTSNTKFLRHTVDLSRPVWKLVMGVKENAEQNRFFDSSSDSLLLNSASFQEFQGYINTLDTLKARASLSFKRRNDKLPDENSLKNSSQSDEVNFLADFSSNPDHTFRTSTTYRDLIIKDTSLTQQDPAKTLVNRFDHVLNVWKGILSFNTYYEVGTGQDRKLEYYYLRVNDGQGVYAYIGDDNNNGVQDLNEFAVSAFPEQANYIRIYLPTNEFTSTRSNQFSEVFIISPVGKKGSFQGKVKFIHRLTNQLSIRLDRKSKDESLLSSLNPFYQDIADTSLLSANSSLRNTFYYNKLSPVYGFDLTWQENRNKVFLTNGFESRLQLLKILNVRWNISRSVLATLSFENGNKENESGYFSNRNYSIRSNSTEPKLSFQPGNDFRIIASYKYGDKKNTTGDLNERSISNRFLIELKYTTVNTGNISVKASIVDIDYNAADDSYLAYDMLEGYKNGKNYTWGAAIQRTLNNSIQLSLTYDGRKLQDSPVTHTGGMQFRAFF